jgi:uncharacterized protein (DUF2141 family)
MDFRLFIALALFLSSCAQVGTITGGEKDTVAPDAIKTNPPNGTVEFNQSSFTMDFDEYIQLINPQQTMSIVPGGIKLNAKLNKKQVTVTLDGNLMPGTTYVVSFNGTIKDVTEGNDSLLQYVFSTGISIDSAELCVRIADAWTLSPLDKITVGLFTDTNEISPYYFAKSGKDGIARFRYLRNGTYRVRAFEDVNGDVSIQPYERCGFTDDSVVVQAGVLDTLSLKLFSPIVNRKVNSFKTAGINRYVVGANFSLVDAQLILNGSPITRENRSHITEDSVYLYSAFTDLTEANLVVLKDSFVDTLKTRIAPKDKTFPLRVMPDKKAAMLAPKDTLSYSVNGKISALDSAYISVKNLADSSFVPFELALVGVNEFSVFPKQKIEKGVVVLKKGAVNCGSTMNMDSTGFAFQYGAIEDFGVLDAVLSDFKGRLILQLKRGNELVSERTCEGGTTVHYEYLEPAEYTFVLIEDRDGNGKWTSGNLGQHIQPEMVYRYSQATKVRANWDVSVELRP